MAEPLVTQSTRPEKIEGRRIFLTPLRLEHIYTHFDWNNDPELNRLDSELPFARESFGAFKERFERMVLEPVPTSRDFEISTMDGVLIGVAYVSDISPHSRRCKLGITIGDRDYWGRGLGREALALLLAYCFDTLGAHRVGTNTFEFNEAWKHLIEGFGFRCEGIERDYLWRDERFWDKYSYGLLENEYHPEGTGSVDDEPRPAAGEAALDGLTPQ